MFACKLFVPPVFIRMSVTVCYCLFYFFLFCLWLFVLGFCYPKDSCSKHELRSSVPHVLFCFFSCHPTWGGFCFLFLCWVFVVLLLLFFFFGGGGGVGLVWLVASPLPDHVWFREDLAVGTALPCLQQ